MKKLLFVSIIFLIAIQFNFAQGSQSMRDREPKIEKLGLTEQQQDLFNNIKYSFDKEKIEFQSKLKMNRLEMRKLKNSDAIDENQMMRLIDEGSKIRTDLQKSRFKMWLSINNILDDDQKVIWKKIRMGQGKHIGSFRDKGNRNSFRRKREFN